MTRAHRHRLVFKMATLTLECRDCPAVFGPPIIAPVRRRPLPDPECLICTGRTPQRTRRRVPKFKSPVRY